MILRKCRTEDDGTVHAVLIVFVLVVSALAGRQFFMDGTNFIVQSKAGYIDARPLTASSAKPLATAKRVSAALQSCFPPLATFVP
jgi:hypothetical protein